MFRSFLLLLTTEICSSADDNIANEFSRRSTDWIILQCKCIVIDTRFICEKGFIVVIKFFGKWMAVITARAEVKIEGLYRVMLLRETRADCCD